MSKSRELIENDTRGDGCTGKLYTRHEGVGFMQ